MQLLSSFSVFPFLIFTDFEFFSFMPWPGPPEINPQLKNQSFLYNSPLRFNCSLRGFPKPEVLLTKDGVNLSVRFLLILVSLFYVEASVKRPVFHIWYCTRGFLLSD